MTTIVFPGQGSQNIAMGKDFNDNFKIANLAYQEIEDYSQINVRKIIFENEGGKLDLTKFSRSGALLPKKINSKHIISIAIVAFGKKHRVNLDISEIAFY